MLSLSQAVTVLVCCVVALSAGMSAEQIVVSGDNMTVRLFDGNYVAVDRCILVIGGKNDTGAPLVEYYHPTAQCSAPTISTENVDKTVYTSGCFLPERQQIVIRENRRPDKPPMMYQLSNGVAKSLSLPYSRYISDTTAAEWQGRCLSCGGWDGSNGDVDFSAPLTQCYAFSADTWTPISALPQPRRSAASVALAGSYYVIGGVNVYPSKEVYRYDTISGDWHAETPMARERFWHCAAVLSASELIACGGFPTRRDCTVYTTTTRTWSDKVAEMNRAREEFAMVVFGGSVHALGGLGGSPYYLDTVEVYDRATNTWRMAANKLRGGRTAFVAVVV